MPHIRVIYPNNREDVKKILRDNRGVIRGTLAEFLDCSAEQIALIPEPLSPEALEFAENILPLELVIETGDYPEDGLDDILSNDFVKRLLLNCESLKTINFGVWIKQPKSNGFTEYMPEKLKG